RRGYSTTVRELARRFDEPVIELRANLRLIFDAFELADLPNVDACLHDYDVLAERLRLPKSRWPSAMVRAMKALGQGRLADYELHLAEATRLAADANDGFFSATTMLGHRIMVLRTLGRGDDIARERLELSRFSAIAATFTYHEVTSMLHARAGQLAE